MENTEKFTQSGRETPAGAAEWPLKLFARSVLKQRKWREIGALLGPVAGRRGLDIGSDNGVISYLLRGLGGSWKSADLYEATVASIRSLVGAGVYQIDGGRTPFADDEFDLVVIVDFLEHIPDDAGFVAELERILKPGGRLIVNVPHRREGLLRRLRYALGQTDEQHGHLRPGYTLPGLRRLLGERFDLHTAHTYSRFFSELIDTLIVFAAGRARGRSAGAAVSGKGLVVTGADLERNRKQFQLYTLVYPFVWLVARLDALLFFTPGYMLIAAATVRKPAAPPPGAAAGEVRP